MKTRYLDTLAIVVLLLAVVTATSCTQTVKQSSEPLRMKMTTDIPESITTAGQGGNTDRHPRVLRWDPHQKDG
jgi:hypothetical protein